MNTLAEIDHFLKSRGIMDAKIGEVAMGFVRVITKNRLPEAVESELLERVAAGLQVQFEYKHFMSEPRMVSITAEVYIEKEVVTGNEYFDGALKDYLKYCEEKEDGKL